MTEARGLRVAALRVSNILGIQTAEIRPGQITLIEGANGSGKTSVLEAFRAALSGGHDATLLRQGADSGEIVMLLDDGVEIAKTVTADKTTVAVRHPEFGKVAKPATFLDRLRDLFSLNPVDFLTAKKDARLQLLLAAIPMKINARDLAGVLGLCTVRPNLDQHAMLTLSAIEKDLYDNRTGVNRVVKEKRTTAGELAKALPPEADQSAIDDLKAAREAQRADLADYTIRRQSVGAAADDEKHRLREEAQLAIDAIRVQLAKDVERVAVDTQAKLQDLYDKHGQSEQELAKCVIELEAKAETYRRSTDARRHLQDLQTSAETFESKSKQLSEALKEVGEIREALLEDLPIKGLTVVDGDIQIDGIPFDRLNEARRVRLAIDVAMLRAGSLPLLCCDGIESLDSASIAALEEVARDTNIQLVLARVTDSKLGVRIIA